MITVSLDRFTYMHDRGLRIAGVKCCNWQQEFALQMRHHIRGSPLHTGLAQSLHEPAAGQ